MKSAQENKLVSILKICIGKIKVWFKSKTRPFHFISNSRNDFENHQYFKIQTSHINFSIPPSNDAICMMITEKTMPQCLHSPTHEYNYLQLKKVSKGVFNGVGVSRRNIEVHFFIAID